MADIKTELEENQIILLVLPKTNYKNQLFDALKELNKISKKICYITVNRPAVSLISDLKNEGFDEKKFNIIDLLTNSVKKPETITQVKYVNSPSNLIDLGLKFTACLREGADSSVFDSISTLLVYSEENSVIKFAHSVMTKVRVAEAKAIFVALKEDKSTNLIKDLYMFVDDVIDMVGGEE